jgi:hypothetical protein
VGAQGKGWIRAHTIAGGPVVIRETGLCELWGSVYEFTALQQPQGASWTAFKDAELIGSGLATDLEAARNAAERCAAPTAARLAELRRALGKTAT